jgi:amidase
MKSPAALLLKLSPNNNDAALKIPYGQGRFDGMLSDKTTAEELFK